MKARSVYWAIVNVAAVCLATFAADIRHGQAQARFPADNQDEFAHQLSLMSLEELLATEISTASRSLQALGDAPGIVTVWTKDAIADYGFRNLEDLLQLVTGFTVTRNSLFSANHAAIQVRGGFDFFSQHVLILLNGRRLNEPVTGGATTFHFSIPIDAVERVEVIRGPGGALYGANAAYAVVNLVTNDDDLDQGTVEVRTGSRKGLHLSGQYSGTIGPDVDYRLYGNVHNYDFDEVDQNDTVVLDTGDMSEVRTWRERHVAERVRTATSHASLSWHGFTLEWQYSYQRMQAPIGIGMSSSELDFDASGTPRFVSHEQGQGQTDVHHVMWGLNWQRTWLSGLSMRADGYHQYSTYDHHWSAANLSLVLPTAGEAFERSNLLGRGTQQLALADVQLDWEGWINHRWMAGLSAMPERAGRLGRFEFGQSQPELPYFDQYLPQNPEQAEIEKISRNSIAAFVQHQWTRFDWLKTTAGVRCDRYDSFGLSCKPRVNLLLRRRGLADLRIDFSRAFRAPSLQEVNREQGNILYKNLDLEPENIRTADMQLRLFPWPTLQIDVGGYVTRVDSAIVIAEVPSDDLATPGQQSQNIGASEFIGLEAEMVGQWASVLRGFINVHHVLRADETVDGMSKRVTGIPVTGINAGLTARYAPLSMTLYGSSRFNYRRVPAISPSGGSIVYPSLELPAHLRLNANLALAAELLDRPLSISISGFNLLDHRVVHRTEASVPNGYATNDRQVLLGLRWQY